MAKSYFKYLKKLSKSIVINTKVFADTIKKYFLLLLKIIIHFLRRKIQLIFQLFFWISLFILSLSYINQKISIFSTLIIVIIILLIINSYKKFLKKSDITVFKEVLKDIKKSKNETRNIFIIGLNTFGFSGLVICVQNFNKIRLSDSYFNIIFLQNILLRVFDLFMILFLVVILIYSFIKSKKNKAPEVLGGLSVILIFVGTFYNLYMPTTISLLLMALSYVLALWMLYIKSKLLLFERSKRYFPFYKKIMITFVPRLFIMNQISSIIVAISLNFIIFGGLPFSEKYYKECTLRMYDSLKFLSKGSDVFVIFDKEADIGYKDSNYEKIMQTYKTNTNMQKAITSLSLCRESALNGGKYTWRKYNIFEIYYFLSNTTLVSFDFFFNHFPILFQTLVNEDTCVKVVETILGDANCSEECIENKLSKPLIVDGINKIIIDASKFNDSIDKFPIWLSKNIPKIAWVVEFGRMIETKFWVILNYSKLKHEYPNETLLIYRKEILIHAKTKKHGILHPKWGKNFRFKFDEEIYGILWKN